MKLMVICILTTIEDQKIKKIHKQLIRLNKQLLNEKNKIVGEDVNIQLANGYPMDQSELGDNKELYNIISDLFPYQKNFYDKYDGIPDCESMMEYIAEMGGRVFIIGDIKGSVIKHYDICKKWIDKNDIIRLPI